MLEVLVNQFVSVASLQSLMMILQLLYLPAKGLILIVEDMKLL